MLNLSSNLHHLVRRQALFNMSPKKQFKQNKSSSGGAANKEGAAGKREAIEVDKEGNINLNLHVKPGSKENGILGEINMPDQPRLDVKITAKAVDGQANAAIIDYISGLVCVRKGDCTLTKGTKSREKTISIKSGTVTLEDCKEKIKTAIEKASKC